MIIDELAARANPSLVRIWSPLTLVQLERVLWRNVLRAQIELGASIPAWALEATTNHVRLHRPNAQTLMRIEERERKTRHDLKARLEIFCEDVGHEYHHVGMTSADVVENCYQIRVRDSLLLLQRDWRIQFDPHRYPLRGIKGPVGTQQDQMDILGSAELAQALDRRIAEGFGFLDVATAVPQVMFRSLDHQIVTELLSQATALSEGHGRPLLGLLSGFATMTAAIAGDTWLEGDVASSVVRRYALPGAIFAFDVAMRGWLDEPPVG